MLSAEDPQRDYAVPDLIHVSSSSISWGSCMSPAVGQREDTSGQRTTQREMRGSIRVKTLANRPGSSEHAGKTLFKELPE